MSEKFNPLTVEQDLYIQTQNQMGQAVFAATELSYSVAQFSCFDTNFAKNPPCSKHACVKCA